ncbi:family 20 glycosylhydrolase [Pseudoalteromonas sp. Cnat2-41]|uniref:family 20 glycosylhydrolase n=1 Tax=unclassified Pseudoalteromonas TaxID=194690 RepID=UPI001EF934A5|nr:MULTISPECIES: family 20 glycosylhydrolase [unclassified Pseudoalteromonas]MCF2861994.1 carbohydate-binding domain-containing protein [Pseudoalteromonas sp. CNAT2-18]MCG7559633.1 carbohydate-binding domain-containing protein [Pseudoalteromonas sp. CNAT2-18.1]
MFRKRLIAALMLPIAAQAQLSQEQVNQFAANTEFMFAVEDNFHNKDRSFLGSITLTNRSDVALPAGQGDWQIYLHNVRKMKEQSVKGLRIEHVNGDLHRLIPTSDFAGLASGETLVIPFEASVWIVAYSDFMPRAFVVAKDTKPAIFANTDSEDFSDFVTPFSEPKQLRRYNNPEDKTILVDAKVRFERNQGLTKVDAEQAVKRIIPRPQEVDYHRGSAVLDESWSISFAGQLSSEVALFTADLKAKYGLNLSAQADHLNTGEDKVIKLSVDAQVGEPEGYYLEIDDNIIRIIGHDNAGAFYGMQSLLALLPATGAATLPNLEVRDNPRYGWRGMHYDNGRNYHGKAAMFKLVEQMARYKMNRLHWHFSEDEGWRLEIPGLPELTEIGAYRCFDLQENRCLLTQLGTGPFKSGSGNGYLSRADFIELLQFAKARHIEIIPEIEGPGHARASIKAMEARYRRLKQQAEQYAQGSLTNPQPDTQEFSQVDLSAATRYLLSDPKDTSSYITVQNYTDNSMNVCLDSTYAFMDKVTYELQQMYREAGTKLRYLHIGGDEVGAGSWIGSPACQALFAEANNGVAGVADLKPYFTQRVAQLLHKRGIAPGVWEDGIMYDKVNPFNRDEYPNEVFFTNAWDNIWEWGVADRAYRLANAGYQVILSHGTHLYFDHPYEAHPQERGYYWATRYTDTEKVFGYMPDDLYANADYTRARDKIDNLEALVGRPMPALEKPENVLGMQGQVWSETIRTEEQVLAMVFPRMLAVAERAWHKAKWEGEQPDSRARQQDWQRFASALAIKELYKLDRDGITLHLPVPGGVIEQGKLVANSAYPGLGIEYSLDNGSTWQPYKQSVTVSANAEVLLRSRVNNQISRTTSVR